MLVGSQWHEIMELMLYNATMQHNARKVTDVIMMGLHFVISQPKYEWKEWTFQQDLALTLIVQSF